MIQTFSRNTLLYLTLCFVLSSAAFGQDGVLIDYTGNTRHNSAVLDVRSNNQGLLAPRVALTASNSASPVSSPATSLLVYNTATAGSAPNNVTPGYYYWDGSTWKRLMSGNTTPLSGSGTATRVAFWSGTNSLSSDVDLYWDNTNKRLGVGTAAPSQLLDIDGSSQFRNTMYFGDANNEGLISWTSNMGNGEAGLVIRGQTNRGIIMGANNSSDLMIDLAGNVGIGTTTGPGQRLDVAGGSIRTTHQLMSTIATGTSPLQVNSTTLNTNLNADLLDGWHAQQLQFEQSNRNFPNGTLIQTDIDYSVSNGEPWLLEIEGNSYGSRVPFDIKIQGYIYSNTIINYGGISNGTTITGISVFNYNGNLCFWFPQQAYWQGFNVFVNDSYGGIKNNRLVSITHQAKPGGITKEVDLTSSIRQSWHSGNFTPSSYAPTTGGTGYIQNQVSTDQAAGFRINGNGLFNGGSVGIGTTNPGSYRLNVQGGSAQSLIESSSDAPLAIRGSNTWSGIGFSDVNGSDNFWYNGQYSTFTIGGGGSNVSGKKLHIDGATSIGSGYDSNSVPTNGLVVQGSVGVGTNTPVSMLEIDGGAANWNETTPGTTVGSLHLDPGATTDHVGSAITWGASDAGSGDNAQAGIYVRTDGSYGSKMYFGTTDSYAAGSKTRMLINQSGQVGINTTAPTQQLDINGQVRIRGGSPAVGKVLTATDANGNATWQTPTSNTAATASSGGTGWKRIAHVTGSSGRGHGKVTLYTTGGSFSPRMTTINWFHDWNSTAGLTLSSESDAAYWSDVRITDDGNNSYIEVYFTSNVTQLSLLSDNYGYRPATLYSGTLPNGGGPVRASAKVGRFNAGEDQVFADYNGDVGIGTGSPDQKLHVAGNLKLDDNIMVEGNSSVRVYRNLASYSAGGGSPGAFVINTSQPWNSACMFRLKVEGYFYDSTAPFEMTIGGYMYTSNNFYNYGYVNVGAKKLNVRFARNTSTNTLAVIIGTESEAYSYPKLSVTSYMQGHSTPDESYADGWSISQISSLSGYDYVHNVPDNTHIGQGASVYSSSSELNLASNNSGSYSSSPGVGWTPGTWQDVSSFSVTRSITSGNMVQITAEGLVEGDNYNYYVPSCVYFRLLRGSTEIARTAVYLTAANYVPSSFWYFNSNNFSMNVVETSVSGSQTYKVQYWMPNEFSATEYVRIGSRRLNVVETNQ